MNPNNYQQQKQVENGVYVLTFLCFALCSRCVDLEYLLGESILHEFSEMLCC